jgi:hypothetical protein
MDDPLNELDRMANVLAMELPHRIEIRGSQLQQVSIVSQSSHGRTDFIFGSANMPMEVLELLGQQPGLPKVLLVELYNEQLVSVLQALAGNVQSLDIANCYIADQHEDSKVHAFHRLVTLNIYSSHLTDTHIHALVFASARTLQHFSLYLVAAGARSIDAIFGGLFLPTLESVDLRGRFVSRDKCFKAEYLPALTNVVIVETLGSHVHLGHVVNHTMQEIIFGKTVATARDLQVLGECMCHEHCQMKRMHLFAVNLQHDVTQQGLEELMQAFRHNRSLVEIAIGAEAFKSNQGELQALMMRNKYLTQGLGRIKDIRMLPQYVTKIAQEPNILGTVTPREQTDVVYFMVRERPDLFGRGTIR